MRQTDSAFTRDVARPQSVTPGRLVLAAGSVFIVLVAALAAATIYFQRQQSVEDWRVNLINFARLLGEHARQTINAADLVQRSIADRVVEMGVEDDEGLRRALGSRATYDMLKDKVSGVPQIDVATIVAANGDVVNFTRSYPPPPINLADRDYFQAHFSDPDLKFFLSLPARNRVNGRWTFYLTRKIRNSRGETIGLVLTGIESSFFSEYYRAVNFSEFSAISLYRDDGGLLARMPERDESMGILLPQPALKALRDGLSALITREPRLVDQADTRFRIAAPIAISGYPLAVVVTATEELVFGDWRRKAILIGSGSLALCLSFAMLMVWIARLMTNRETAMALARQARDAAERANLSKSEFLAMMSHEIRTPLNGILGMVTLLSDTGMTNSQRHLTETVRVSSEALLTIINDILDYSKLEAGRLDLEDYPYDVGILVEGVADVFAPHLAEKGLVLDLQIAPEAAGRYLGDANRVRQVLLNLVGNAVKFTEHGRIRIEVLMEHREGREWLSFSVTDSGVGIPADIQGRLFARFTQGDSSTARRYGGSGLGLAISKNIVELMGGRIGVRSDEGQGSCFWFDLPLRRADAEDHPEATAGLQAVVCGPETTDRDDILRHLARRRVDVTVAETPVAVLAVLRQAVADGSPFDVVVVDDRSDGLSPADLAAIVAADRSLAGTRIIAVRGDDAAMSTGWPVTELRRPVRGRDVAAALAANPEEDAVSPVPTRQMRVLLVEDNATNQQVAIGFLAKLGQLVDVAGDGAESLRMLQRSDYDLVFMDIQMPDMDGYEATRRIRSSGERFAGIPVIAMTASAMTGDREKCLDAGMDDYIAKPINRLALAALLEKWSRKTEEGEILREELPTMGRS
ncbi:ATP-binding protein [Telmatospirillum sp.]|uniref:hybrid sensor histidine kinase/response regulator n=1 Tax=Telmatospirillum sp. TaxID=2079197 RepID=UPI00283D33E0|nr:ATP-binding protein [Telmatospirillum sp.]MDR3439129.1 ATP-binding protein [Telmatospirillum sp.]